MPRKPKPGDRIRLIDTTNDPDPIMIGQTGTIVNIIRHGGGEDAWHQIDVNWDNGRALMIVSPPDQFEILPRSK